MELSQLSQLHKRIDVHKIQLFGSRVVGCATEKSDYDYIVLVTQRPSLKDMEGSGFVPDASDPLYGKDFSSWRKGSTNLVFTDSGAYFNVTVEACDFCKKYKVFDKADRCMIHEKFREALGSWDNSSFF